jgi:hypothetical protein
LKYSNKTLLFEHVHRLRELAYGFSSVGNTVYLEMPIDALALEARAAETLREQALVELYAIRPYGQVAASKIKQMKLIYEYRVGGVQHQRPTGAGLDAAHVLGTLADVLIAVDEAAELVNPEPTVPVGSDGEPGSAARPNGAISRTTATDRQLYALIGEENFRVLRNSSLWMLYHAKVKHLKDNPEGFRAACNRIRRSFGLPGSDAIRKKSGQRS